jgi:hypothetical protein
VSTQTFLPAELHVAQLTSVSEQESGEKESSIFRIDVLQVPTLVWLKQI